MQPKINKHIKVSSLVFLKHSTRQVFENVMDGHISYFKKQSESSGPGPTG